jgi:Protein of unknown function (DUF3987)
MSAAYETPEQRRDRAGIIRLRVDDETGTPLEWPTPDVRLVDDDRTPAPPLDDAALPSGWGTWITQEAASRACPRDYVAASLIAAASAWIGNARHAAATATWSEPPHIWLALIGEPSMGKTPAERPIIEACGTIERDAEPGWQAAMVEHAGLVEGARAIKEQWCAAVREAIKGGRSAPERPPGVDAPPEPPKPRVLAMDATTEELQHLLAGQPRGLLYARDELTGWFGTMIAMAAMAATVHSFSSVGTAAPTCAIA